MTKLGFCLAYTPDVEKKVAFYERAFGMERKYIAENKAYGEMHGDVPLCFVEESFGEKGVGPFTAARPAAPPLGVELGIIVDDVAGAFERAVAAGAAPHRTPEQKPWGQTVAYVRDLDGALVELCTPWTV